MIALPTIPYNTLVVAAGVAAVGFAAGVVGSLGVLRKRALVGDAAAHATLVGVAAAFLMTGRRDLPALLLGAFVAAVGSLGVLVLIRRVTRTRDDAATAIVLGVSFGLGITLVSGITARGIPGGAGLEQFLLGHTAALTAADAVLLAGVSATAVLLLAIGLKEATIVAFDAAFAAASGWPVGMIDYALVTLVAVMVVVGLPAAGAVLVTALVVIPPVAARQWTDRVTTMLVLAGCFGLVAGLVGVGLSAAVPRLSTGPVVVLVAAAIFVVSFYGSPSRGWLARWRRQRALAQGWAEGRIIEAALHAMQASSSGYFTRQSIESRLGTAVAPGRSSTMASSRAWRGLLLRHAIEPAPASEASALATQSSQGISLWRLTEQGKAEAVERARRLALWGDVLAVASGDARAFLTIDLPPPEAVLDAARLHAIRAAAAASGS